MRGTERGGAAVLLCHAQRKTRSPFASRLTTARSASIAVRPSPQSQLRRDDMPAPIQAAQSAPQPALAPLPPAAPPSPPAAPQPSATPAPSASETAAVAENERLKAVLKESTRMLLRYEADRQRLADQHEARALASNAARHAVTSPREIRRRPRRKSKQKQDVGSSATTKRRKSRGSISSRSSARRRRISRGSERSSNSFEDSDDWSSAREVVFDGGGAASLAPHSGGPPEELHRAESNGSSGSSIAAAAGGSGGGGGAGSSALVQGSPASAWRRVKLKALAVSKITDSSAKKSLRRMLRHGAVFLVRVVSLSAAPVAAEPWRRCLVTASTKRVYVQSSRVKLDASAGLSAGAPRGETDIVFRAECVAQITHGAMPAELDAELVSESFEMCHGDLRRYFALNVVSATLNVLVELVVLPDNLHASGAYASGTLAGEGSASAAATEQHHEGVAEEKCAKTASSWVDALKYLAQRRVRTLAAKAKSKVTDGASGNHPSGGGGGLQSNDAVSHSNANGRRLSGTSDVSHSGASATSNTLLSESVFGDGSGTSVGDSASISASVSVSATQELRRVSSGSIGSIGFSRRADGGGASGVAASLPAMPDEVADATMLSLPPQVDDLIRRATVLIESPLCTPASSVASSPKRLGSPQLLGLSPFSVPGPGAKAPGSAARRGDARHARDSNFAPSPPTFSRPATASVAAAGGSTAAPKAARGESARAHRVSVNRRGLVCIGGAGSGGERPGARPGGDVRAAPQQSCAAPSAQQYADPFAELDAEAEAEGARSKDDLLRPFVRVNRHGSVFIGGSGLGDVFGGSGGDGGAIGLRGSDGGGGNALAALRAMHARGSRGGSGDGSEDGNERSDSCSPVFFNDRLEGVNEAGALDAMPADEQRLRAYLSLNSMSTVLEESDVDELSRYPTAGSLSSMPGRATPKAIVSSLVKVDEDDKMEASDRGRRFSVDPFVLAQAVKAGGLLRENHDEKVEASDMGTDDMSSIAEVISLWTDALGTSHTHKKMVADAEKKNAVDRRRNFTRAMALFRSVDADSSGSVDLSELEHIITTSGSSFSVFFQNWLQASNEKGHALPADELQCVHLCAVELMEEFDSDKNGTLERKEFIRLFKTMWRISDGESSTRAMALFDEVDTNHDGLVSTAELRSIINTPGSSFALFFDRWLDSNREKGNPLPLSSLERANICVRELMAQFDANGDGVLERHEFARLFKY